MPILVSSKDEHLIKVNIKYVDKGKSGLIVFENEEKLNNWIEKRQEKIDKESKKEEGKSAKDSIKELNTWWKRMDWGTQSKIMKESQVTNSNGDNEMDWVQYRFSQMKYLLIKWDLEDSEGNPLPVNEKLFSRLDYELALVLLAKYDEAISSSEEENENFE